MYPIINRIIINITLIPITIISCIIAIPITLIFLPFGIHFAIVSNNNLYDKFYNSLIILIYGLPLYYYLSICMIINVISYNMFNYMGIKYYNY